MLGAKLCAFGLSKPICICSQTDACRAQSKHVNTTTDTGRDDFICAERMMRSKCSQTRRQYKDGRWRAGTSQHLIIALFENTTSYSPEPLNARWLPHGQRVCICDAFVAVCGSDILYWCRCTKGPSVFVKTAQEIVW